jgi:nucleoside-diphosphate-sugar epimerase
MKTLITGVSGRVGANLAWQLMKRGHEIRGLVFPSDPKLDKVHGLGIEVVEADLTDADGVRRACEGCDRIAHLAAQMKLGNSTPQQMFATNAVGTLNVLEGAVHAGGRRRSVLLAGTDQSYPPFVSDKSTFTEDTPQRPIDLYAVTKLSCEQMFLTYLREFGLPTRIVRFGSVIAGDEALELQYPAWLDAYVNRDWTIPHRIPWFGQEHVAAAKAAVAMAMETPNAVCAITDAAGNPWGTPYTDVRDTVAGAILALESDAALGEAFNIVGPAAVPYDAMARLIADATGRPYLEVRMPFLWWFNVSVDKAKRVLGYVPKHTYADMVAAGVAARNGQDIDVVPV